MFEKRVVSSTCVKKDLGFTTGLDNEQLISVLVFDQAGFLHISFHVRHAEKSGQLDVILAYCHGWQFLDAAQAF